jgi:hypothetical protein
LLRAESIAEPRALLRAESVAESRGLVGDRCVNETTQFAVGIDPDTSPPAPVFALRSERSAPEMIRKSILVLVALELVLLACAQPQAPSRRNASRDLFGETIRDDFAYFAATPPAPEYLNYSQEEAAYATAALNGQDLEAQRRSLNTEFIRNIPKVRVALLLLSSNAPPSALLP